jgi:hypothetical protein
MNSVSKQNELIRIGVDDLVNKSELDTSNAFNLVFGDYHELVYVPDDDIAWQVVNGSWNGAMGYLMNGIRMDWR